MGNQPVACAELHIAGIDFPAAVDSELELLDRMDYEALKFARAPCVV